MRSKPYYSFGWHQLMLRATSWIFKWRRKAKCAGLLWADSLVASLRRSLMDLALPLWLNTDFSGLINDNQRITGITVQQDGTERELYARYGVNFASGGFEQSPARSLSAEARAAGPTAGQQHRCSIDCGMEQVLPPPC